MTRKELRKLVREEAYKLKLNAGNGELNNLSFKDLDPSLPNTCIYGQMTGSCWSIRSMELLEKCALPVSCTLSTHSIKGEKIEESFGFSPLAYKKESIHRDYFSAIELYIMQPWAKNDNLIAYLKGETKKLDI